MWGSNGICKTRKLPFSIYPILEIKGLGKNSYFTDFIILEAVNGFFKVGNLLLFGCMKETRILQVSGFGTAHPNYLTVRKQPVA